MDFLESWYPSHGFFYSNGMFGGQIRQKSKKIHVPPSAALFWDPRKSDFFKISAVFEVQYPRTRWVLHKSHFIFCLFVFHCFKKAIDTHGNPHALRDIAIQKRDFLKNVTF